MEIIMDGIWVDSQPIYHFSLFRRFAPHEHHITRTDTVSDILLIMLSGTLRFTENGKRVELSKGEYYIQQSGLLQDGPEESDLPVYFYVHFKGDWTSDGLMLPRRGRCQTDIILNVLNELAAAEQNNEPYIIKTGLFYRILSLLCQMQQKSEQDVLAGIIARRLTKNLRHAPDLDELSDELHYSKNYLIRVFSKSKGMTPHAYLLNVRINQARLLLDTTNATAEAISLECGFSDYAHFYRTFCRIVGQSPKHYRQANRTS